MKICFVFAMQAEAEFLFSQSTILEKREAGYAIICRLDYQGKEFFACISGIGKVLAGSSIASCMTLYPEIEAFVNLGIGGSLNAELAPVMSVVLSKRLIQHDVDTTSFGDPYGYLSSQKIDYIPGDERLIGSLSEVCEDMRLRHCLGTIASGDQFIVDEEVKKIIISRFDALTVDMEAAAFAQIAYGFGKPFVAVRVVSDAVDHQKEYLKYKPIAGKLSSEIGLELVKNIG